MASLLQGHATPVHATCLPLQFLPAHFHIFCLKPCRAGLRFRWVCGYRAGMSEVWVKFRDAGYENPGKNTLEYRSQVTQIVGSLGPRGRGSP